MSVFCVGDIHGCFSELKSLLSAVRFDSAKDTLWCTGDIIGRGPEPLETLRFFLDNRNSIVTVLGNHELSLLRNYAEYAEYPCDSSRQAYLDNAKAPELRLILRDARGDEMISYLRSRPLAYYDDSRKILLTHAGLSPEWDVAQALACSKEVESFIASNNFTTLMKGMFSDKPARWSKLLKKQQKAEQKAQSDNADDDDNDSVLGSDCEALWVKRCIYSINALTRMRFIKPNLALEILSKDSPEENAKRGTQLRPWYDCPTKLRDDEKVIFGHWAALQGKCPVRNMIALDTGCVWNGSLTMINIDEPDVRINVPARRARSTI